METKVQQLYSNQIENLIFDLGGVLLDIDYTATLKALADLGVKNVEQMYTQAAQTALFDRFDVGAISPGEFRAELRKLSAKNISDAQIDAAWCAMLGDFRKETMHLLLQLKSRFRTFLYSNTNEIHVPVFEKMLAEQLGKKPEDYFERHYYSNQMGARKPNPEGFLRILHENNLPAERTLFIDDTPGHIIGAQAVGLRTYHLAKGEKITDLF
ncbi:MAG: HAD family phosphatase [Prevotellaceae bacterium]|jgi:putative hydrolase of the HAD superfamily|nr:HAD family phosphatase [Prevotellaceae bacterium]